jgi:hypothetical protein
MNILVLPGVSLPITVQGILNELIIFIAIIMHADTSIKYIHSAWIIDECLTIFKYRIFSRGSPARDHFEKDAIGPQN